MNPARGDLEDLRGELSESDIQVDINVEEGQYIPNTILEYARGIETDSIIVAAAGEGILRRVLVGEVPETIGGRLLGK